MFHRAFLCVVAVLACLCLGAGPCQGRRYPARISVLMATGMPGGTYYHVGLAMASLWTTKLQDLGIRVSAAISEGSRENIQAIRIEDADIILAEEYLCAMAYAGISIYKDKPVRELRSIATLWPDAVHLLIRKDKVQSGTVQDLQGLVLATGLADSGSRFTAEALVRSIKSPKRRIRLRHMSNKSAAEALRRGIVQGIELTGGVPVPLVTTLFSEAKPPLAFLEIDDTQLDALGSQGLVHAFREVIPEDTYPGQDRAVKTIGLVNLLAVTASLDAEVVYALTKTLYENTDYLSKVHRACRDISIQKALSGMHVPLHPGAARYYMERDVKIPDHLLR